MQVNLHVWSSNLNILWNILETDGQIKSKRYTVQLCQTKAGHMVAGDVEVVFASRIRDCLNKLKSKLEIIMEERMLDTCQLKYVL